MAHDHEAPRAGTAAGRHRRRLIWTLGLTGLFMGVEVGGGLWTGSLALLADAAHMLTDAGGLVMSLVAAWFAEKPPTAANTYGYAGDPRRPRQRRRALRRRRRRPLRSVPSPLGPPPEILAGPMLGIAVLGLGVNLAGLWLLRGGAGESLNVRGAYLEVLGDALGSVAVILAAIIIRTTGFVLADPIISAGIGLFILPRTWGLMRQAIQILMEGVPPHLDPREIDAAMRASHGIRAVHDLHIWTLTSGKDALSAHVRVDDLADGRHVLGDLQQLLRDRFGIEHPTIQLESDEPLLQIGRAPTTPGDRSGSEPAATAPGSKPRMPSGKPEPDA